MPKTLDDIVGKIRVSTLYHTFTSFGVDVFLLYTIIHLILQDYEIHFRQNPKSRETKDKIRHFLGYTTSDGDK